MKIDSFEFHDRATDWKLEPVHFENLTLLIGASGVGKTLILKSILQIKDIADGKSYTDIEWHIRFETTNKKKYTWEGAFDKEKGDIEYENITLDGKVIVKRDQNKISFMGKPTPKLSKKESVIWLLKEEDTISPAFQDFQKILLHEYSTALNHALYVNDNHPFEISEFSGKYGTLERIRQLNDKISTKLTYAFLNVPNTFMEIKNTFIEIFPQVEDLKIEKKVQLEKYSGFTEYYYISIKERGVENWIHQSKISSGMFRTLMHIAELHLAPEGTLILIDEFENSLGVNCLDVITDTLMTMGRNIRFIITSHHPYIINNIDFNHWKVVTRKGGVVKTLDPVSLNLGKSRHDAFIQLINHHQYANGIEAKTG